MKSRVSTKPIAILAIGCLPLAVLTVASFAGIANLDSELPSTDERDLALPGASVPLHGLETDQTLCAAIAEREFLAGEPLSERALEARPVYLTSLATDWKRWSDATSLVAEVLAWERSRIGAGVPQLEIARDRIGAIQDACRKKDPAGVALLIAILERRKDDLQAEIVSRRNSENVARLKEDAQRALGNKDYAKAIDLCDQILTQYGAANYQTVSDLRRKATFWQEWSKLPLESPVTEEPAKQRSTLTDFIDRYRDLPDSVEQERILRVTRRLELVEAELRRIEMNQAARVPIAVLARHDGQAFAEGLAEAAAVAETYPTDSVRAQLQERVVLWLAASLPQKSLDEPENLEEVETLSGNVLRGFFEPVTDAGGGVIGYKRYTTAEQRANPTGNVGRYPSADLRGTPTRSVPRQCIDAYESARRRLLADPGNPDGWTALERTCESAEVTLVEYRRKPGSSRDPVSFQKEARFAQSILEPAVWTQMGKIWGK